MPGLEHYLVVSAILFATGLYGALSKGNMVTVLMSVEIMFSGVTLAAVAMSRFVTPAALAASPAAEGDLARAVLTGQVFALFVITVAAAEVAVGLAIVIAAHRHRRTVDVSEMAEMRR